LDIVSQNGLDMHEVYDVRPADYTTTTTTTTSLPLLLRLFTYYYYYYYYYFYCHFEDKL